MMGGRDRVRGLMKRVGMRHSLARFASQGMRRAFWLSHRNTTGFKIVRRSKPYVEDYLHSAFCAAPLGEGWVRDQPCSPRRSAFGSRRGMGP